MEHVAIIVAAGSGKRMNSSIPKQYIELNGYPVLYYTIKAFQDSFINRVVLVVPEGDIEYCRKEIVEKYGFNKVTDIVAGGGERYDSVWNGLKAAGTADYVYIQDGARPFVEQGILIRSKEALLENDAVVAGVPVKDTIKKCDETGIVQTTPDRRSLWQVQTPQSFRMDLIVRAYEALYKDIENEAAFVSVTDDASLVEKYTDTSVKMIMGSYQNIKITTPEDISFGEAILSSKKM